MDSGMVHYKQAKKSDPLKRDLSNTITLLIVCSVIWLACSVIDAIYTPRDPSFKASWGLIVAYQWCMVGYASNLILTFLKVIFEGNRNNHKLHMISCYINLLAALSYGMIWTGFSPIVPDVNSCLYIPQRWILYVFTAPAIIYILSQISDYSPLMRIWVILLNVFMLLSGGLGTIPWISRPHKIFWYVMSCVPFPSILVHMWRMVTAAISETQEPGSKRALHFLRLFSITTWNLFPLVYFGAIDGSIPLEVSEPCWATLDWITKMVYSSSLMEANFLTITQRREFALLAIEEANRLQTIQQLSTAIERKDDFLSAMSHELRTPLNGIIGLTESMLAGSCGGLAELTMKAIRTVNLSGKRLLQLINDILDAAKLKQGMLVIKHEEVNIKRLVSDVVDLSQPLVGKDVLLVNNVGSVPKITGDNGRIVQILYNLVGNACKFTAQGVISISAGVSDDTQQVYISVSDTGVGIPKEKISKIFVAFEQADMSTTRRYGGTGLGLYLVNELVKAHNGSITVESRVGSGSTFTIWLPYNSLDLEQFDMGPGYRDGEAGTREASREEERPRSSSTPAVDGQERGGWVQKHIGMAPNALPAPPDLDSNGMTDSLLSVSRAGFKATKPFYREKYGGCMVLSVDDDPVNQMVVESLLIPEGYKVETVMGGIEALNFLQCNDTLPDVILLDITMPDMSGYEVCLEIRRRFSAVSIPVIMVSAKSHPEHVTKGLEAGSMDYVKKPFHRQELLGRIRAQIRNREIFESEMESRKVTERLKRVMPMSVVQRLQQGQSMIADAHTEVAVLFADVAGFWNLDHGPVANNSADVVLRVTLMNEILSRFEKLLLKYQVFRVDHFGDTYMVVSGHEGTPDYLRRIIQLAQEMLDVTKNLKTSSASQLQIRVGVHTGPAYAGVVGIDNPRYCVFGDTVLIANQLERSGYPHTVHVSEAVVNKLKQKDNFIEYRPRYAIGTFTINTYLMKVGAWFNALAAMKDSKSELETSQASTRAELEAAVQEAAALRLRVNDLSTDLAARERELGDLRLATPTSGSGLRDSLLSRSTSGMNQVREESFPDSQSGVMPGDLLSPSMNREQRLSSPAPNSSGNTNFWSASYPIDAFLRDIGLEQYIPLLMAQEVTPLVLASMKDSEICDLGVNTLGARRRMMEAAAQYESKLRTMTRMMMLYKDGLGATTAAPKVPTSMS